MTDTLQDSTSHFIRRDNLEPIFSENDHKRSPLIARSVIFRASEIAERKADIQGQRLHNVLCSEKLNLSRTNWIPTRIQVKK